MSNFQVSNIFLPGENVFTNPILFGYTTHDREERLQKVDLHKLSVVSAHDFSEYNCHPIDLAYLTNGKKLEFSE